MKDFFKVFFKLLFGKESLVSIVKSLIVVVPAIVGALTYLDYSFNNLIEVKLNEKLMPISQYIGTQTVNDIDKQFYKIKNDPADIKPGDLMYVVQAYSVLCEEFKTPTLDDKITAIRRYYMQIEGANAF